MKVCKTCNYNLEEHPRAFGEFGPRYCNIVLVEDIKGKPVETDNNPYKRTRENNIRWVHKTSLDRVK